MTPILDKVLERGEELLAELGFSGAERGHGEMRVVEDEDVVVQMRPTLVQHPRPAAWNLIPSKVESQLKFKFKFFFQAQSIVLSIPNWSGRIAVTLRYIPVTENREQQYHILSCGL